MRNMLGCAYATLAIALGASAAAAAADKRPGIERSVVRIVNYTQRGDWYAPWEVSSVSAGVGSGFVIRDGLVMTNAHVVSDARLILIYLHNDPNPHPADVFTIGHDCDLALVRPRETGLLDGVPALEFDGLPILGSTVETFGFPQGGTFLSSTRGVVSRIGEQLYLHSGIDRHVAVQTDASINPGNSGGPVIQDGRVVGVAFQASPDLQSVGYFIPAEVIERFQRDVADGRYDGYPELGTQTVNMDNPAARAQAGLAPNESGVRVDSIMSGASADGLLKPGDVLLEIEGHAIANDGTVLEGERRLDFGMLIDRHLIGERATLRVLRAGARETVSVPLAAMPAARLHSNAYERRPRYYVYAGLVFVPLELETLKTYGQRWYSDADRTLLYEFLFRPQREPELSSHERIVLLRRLDHQVNAHLNWSRNEVVERVNGKVVRSVDDLIAAVEGHPGDFHLFEFSSFGRLSVIDRRAADKANAEILTRYGVSKDRQL